MGAGKTEHVKRIIANRTEDWIAERYDNEKYWARNVSKDGSPEDWELPVLGSRWSYSYVEVPAQLVSLQNALAMSSKTPRMDR
jgi:hypothetical protein